MKTKLMKNKISMMALMLGSVFAAQAEMKLDEVWQSM